MSQGPTAAPPVPLKEWAKILLRYSPIWLGCTLVAGALGVGYSLVRNPSWKAAMPMLIRDEAGASFQRQGRFASQTEMKAAQETVSDMARNLEVVKAALEKLGPPVDFTGSSWPSKKTVEEMAKAGIAVRPPQGAEFGSSEVIYLESEADTPERAQQLCTLILEEMSDRLRMLRRVRADSIIGELRETRDVALQRLEEATAELRTLEASVGPDLAELRNLTENSSGDSGVRKSLLDSQTELPTAELELDRLRRLLAMLEVGRNDPDQVVLAGEDLLTLQPTLKRLKDGLIDVQLKRAQLSGRFQPDHPRMKNVVSEEQEIRQRLSQEIESAMSGMGPRLAIAEDRVNRLKQKQIDLSERLNRLAKVRTEYTNLTVQLRQRSDALGQAERALAEAEATRSSSASTDFVEALNAPQVSDDPEGPGKTMLAVGSAMSGAVMGLGLVFLIAPAPSGPRFGRRWSDYGAGRRSADRGAAPAPIAPGAAGVSTVAALPATNLANTNGTATNGTAPNGAATATLERSVETERRRRPREAPL